MEGVIRSLETIETENKGKLATVNTKSFSQTELSELKNKNVIYVEIKDEDIFKLTVCFWEKEKDGHISRKIHTIEGDGDNIICIPSTR